MAEKKSRPVMSREMQAQTLKRLMTYIRRHLILVILSLFFALIGVAFTLYLPVLTGQAVDTLVGKGAVDFAGLGKILVRMAIVISASALAGYFASLVNNRITYLVTAEIRKDAFDKLHRLPLSYVDRQSQGALINHLITDADQVSDGLLMGFTQLFTGVLTIFGTLAFMFSKSIMISLVVVLLTPLSLFVAAFIAKRTYTMFQDMSRVRGEQTAFVDEMLMGAKVVKAFGREEKTNETFREINDRLQKVSLKATFFSSLTNPSTRFVNNLVYAGVAVAGAFLAVQGRITVGTLTTFLSYANQYTKPFNEISGVVTELQNAFACAGSLFKLIDEAEEVPEAEDARVLDVNEAGEVTLSHVTFSYTPEQKLLQDISLAVKKGQRIAIVGPTGCGKTTLINLLMRFYDVKEGSISVAGTDIRNMTRKSLRDSYGMVLQEVWLRSGTILSNLKTGNEDATFEEVQEAAKICHAHNFIMRLPKGYDTEIGEDGGSLSQGQKQLLCITRAMISKPAMLILDEATSSIDTRTERRVQKAFAALMEGKTSFVVAHRLSTIVESDVILVMKDGNIIEQGTHEELLAKGGFYSELYNSQFARSAG